MMKVQSFLFSLLLLLIAVPVRAQQMKLGEVLIITTPTLKDGADAKAFEAHIADQMAPAWKKNVRGAELHLFRADRGAGKGNYLMVWVTDAQKRSTIYLPENNTSPFPEKSLTKLGTFAKPDATYVSNSGAYTDYVLIGADKVGKRQRGADSLCLIIVWDEATHTQHFIRRATFDTAAPDFGFL